MLFEPATMIRCSFEHCARAIIGSTIRSPAGTRGGRVMTVTIQVDELAVTITQSTRSRPPT